MHTFYDIYHPHSVIGNRVFTYKKRKISPTAFPHSEHPSGRRTIHKALRTPVLRCPQGTTELAVGKRAGNSRLDARPYAQN